MKFRRTITGALSIPKNIEIGLNKMKLWCGTSLSFNRFWVKLAPVWMFHFHIQLLLINFRRYHWSVTCRKRLENLEIWVDPTLVYPIVYYSRSADRCGLCEKVPFDISSEQPTHVVNVMIVWTYRLKTIGQWEKYTSWYWTCGFRMFICLCSVNQLKELTQL